MRTRWRGRGRLAGLAILPLLALPLVVGVATGRADATLTLRGPDGRVLDEVGLADGEFTLRYRNSLYRSTAEEHYVVGPDGRIELVGLGADELAVLEEYYAIDEPAVRAAGSVRTWQAEPARAVVLGELTVAATDLGQRTLLVEGRAPIKLWRLVEDASPSVTLEVTR